MTKPAIEGCHKHLWDMSFGTAAKIPEYMRQFGYRSPTSVLDGPLQYATQKKLTLFEYLNSEPERLEDFNNMMTGVRHSRPSWMEWFPVRDRLLDGVRKDTALLIDVGGGWGHDIVAFQKKHAPTERLGLQDLAHVLVDVRDLPQNIECIEYNFLEAEQPVKGARAYFFHFVLHDWPDDKCLQILRNIAPAMTPGYSKILINEYVLPDRGCSMHQAVMDMNMFTMTAGLERTEKQWRKLIEQAGLYISKLWLPDGDGEAIIEVVSKTPE
ncbi:MAG: hypothetical protein Q9225_000790 [Loekoesia sp. 1 TL-2023]